MIGKTLSRLLKNYRLRRRSKKYYAGATFTRFVACDIRREIDVVDATEVNEGYITAKSRTWNVLYSTKGIAPIPEFGEPKRIEIDRIWHWDGPAWGGQVSDDKSEKGI